MKVIIYATLLAGIFLCSFSPGSLAQVKTLGNSRSIVYDISFSKGGTLIAATEGKTVNLFEVASGQLVKKFSGAHGKDVLSVDISADSTMIASGGKDGLVVIRDIESGTILKSVAAHQGVVTAVKFHPASDLIISSGSDDQITVYDYKQGKVIYNLQEHQDDVLSIALSPDGTILASGGADKSIFLWDLRTGTSFQRLLAHESWVRALAFNESGKKLVSAGDDAEIILWNINTGDRSLAEKVTSLKHEKGWVLGIDISGEASKNEVIASAGTSGRVNIRTSFGANSYKLNRTAHKILLKPNNGIYITVALATRGKGLILINGKDMKLAEL